MFELRQLRQFVAVAEELHFGRAAQRLHMTQPPLTQAVRALEGELGTLLFERTRRSVALTPAGDALLEHARKLLKSADELPRLVRAAGEGHSGRLRLGFVSSIAYGPLPEWLRGFRDAHPDVNLQLREATLDVQLQAFDADEIDAGFVLHAPGAAPSGFASRLVLREPLVLVVPAGHALAAKHTLRVADVLDEPLVIFPRPVTPSLFDAVLSFYRAHHATPRIAQEAIQMQTIVNLVSAGMGVAWVPHSVTRLQRPGVEYRRVAGTPLASETSLLWRDGASPVVLRFVQHVQQQMLRRSRAGSRAQSRAAKGAP
jgi:DNA-binding transcriptional LysR family regulator